MNNGCSFIPFHFILYFLICLPCGYRNCNRNNACTFMYAYMQQCEQRRKFSKYWSVKYFILFSFRAIIWPATSQLRNIFPCVSAWVCTASMCCVFIKGCMSVYLLFGNLRLIHWTAGRSVAIRKFCAKNWWFRVDSVNTIMPKMDLHRNEVCKCFAPADVHMTCFPIRKWRIAQKQFHLWNSFLAAPFVRTFLVRIRIRFHFYVPDSWWVLMCWILLAFSRLTWNGRIFEFLHFFGSFIRLYFVISTNTRSLCIYHCIFNPHHEAASSRTRPKFVRLPSDHPWNVIFSFHLQFWMENSS